MSDIMAAIGTEQLNNFEYHKTRRQALAKYYVNCLSEVKSISIFDHDYDNVVPHIFVILLGEGINREGLISFLKERGIPVGIHYKPNHLLSYFSGSINEDLPTTSTLYPRMLTLPLHPELSFEDINTIVKWLKQGIEHVKTTSR